jgi:hypothetical protein
MAMIALMMEAASTSETFVIFYQTTRRNNPEDSHFLTRRRENLTSHLRHAVLLFSAGKYWDNIVDRPQFYVFSLRVTVHIHARISHSTINDTCS